MKKIIQKILIEKRNLLRLMFFTLADAIFISFSVYLAFMVRFEGQIPDRYFLNILGIILLAVIITLPIFYFSRLYYFTWVYVSTTELITLVKATVLSFLLLAASFLILRDHPIFTGFPRSTLFVSYFFIFIFSGGIRFAKRIYLEIFASKKQGSREKVLIVGAGNAGEQILRSIFNFKNTSYLPIGFVDDSIAKQGISIHGLKVLGKIQDIPKIVQKEKIEGLIIALPSAGVQIIKQAVENGRRAGLRKIRIVPPIDEVINGKISIGNLKEIEMEDLLGRESVNLDQELIKNFIKSKKILVTGAAGSIGSELCRQIIKFKPHYLFILDQDETGIFNILGELKSKFPNIKPFIADICDEKRVEQIFTYISPDIVFHAAAYKHVPLMEEHPEEAVKNNVLGTKILTQISLKCGVEKFIFISTDKAVNPTSVMGATKRIGEMICQIFNQTGETRFTSVRFGNVLGSRGSVIPIFKEKIKKRETIEITHSEMKRYFMTTPEACLLVLQAGAMSQGGEVFVLDMGDPINIMDLAKELIKLSGLEPDKDVPIVFTEPRPGEKFFEELLTAEEGIAATINQKIFMAKIINIDEKRIFSGIEEFKKIAYNGKKEDTINKLKEIIPNYNNNG